MPAKKTAARYPARVRDAKRSHATLAPKMTATLRRNPQRHARPQMQVDSDEDQGIAEQQDKDSLSSPTPSGMSAWSDKDFAHDSPHDSSDDFSEIEGVLIAADGIGEHSEARKVAEKWSKRASGKRKNKGVGAAGRKRSQIEKSAASVNVDVLSNIDPERKQFLGRTPPMSDEARVKLATAQAQFVAEDYDDAVANLKDVTRLEPGLADPWVVLSLIFEKRGEHKRMLDAMVLTAYFTSDRDQAKAIWRRIGYKSKQLGFLDQALSAFRRSVSGKISSLEMVDEEVIWELSQLYFERGNVDHGINMLLKLHKITGRDHVAHVVAEKLIALHRWQEALKLLEKLFAKSQESYPPRFDRSLINMLCEVYLELREFSKCAYLIMELMRLDTHIRHCTRETHLASSTLDEAQVQNTLRRGFPEIVSKLTIALCQLRPVGLTREMEVVLECALNVVYSRPPEADPKTFLAVVDSLLADERRNVSPEEFRNRWHIRPTVSAWAAQKALQALDKLSVAKLNEDLRERRAMCLLHLGEVHQAAELLEDLVDSLGECTEKEFKHIRVRGAEAWLQCGYPQRADKLLRPLTYDDLKQSGVLPPAMNSETRREIYTKLLAFLDTADLSTYEPQAAEVQDFASEFQNLVRDCELDYERLYKWTSDEGKPALPPDDNSNNDHEHLGDNQVIRSEEHGDAIGLPQEAECSLEARAEIDSTTTQPTAGQKHAHVSNSSVTSKETKIALEGNDTWKGSEESDTRKGSELGRDEKRRGRVLRKKTREIELCPVARGESSSNAAQLLPGQVQFRTLSSRPNEHEEEHLALKEYDHGKGCEEEHSEAIGSLQESTTAISLCPNKKDQQLALAENSGKKAPLIAFQGGPKPRVRKHEVSILENKSVFFKAKRRHLGLESLEDAFSFEAYLTFVLRGVAKICAFAKRHHGLNHAHVSRAVELCEQILVNRRLIAQRNPMKRKLLKSLVTMSTCLAFESRLWRVLFKHMRALCEEGKDESIALLSRILFSYEDGPFESEHRRVDERLVAKKNRVSDSGLPRTYASCITDARAWALRRLGHCAHSFALSMLCGHFCTSASKHSDAIGIYTRAHRLLPNNAMPCLCLGASYIAFSMSRTAVSRHDLVLKGFAFVQKYQSLRQKKQGTSSGTMEMHLDQIAASAESAYNLGRAFHHLDLIHLAAKSYVEALELVGTAPEVADCKDLEDRVDIKAIRYACAHNLAAILEAQGSIDAARETLRQHIEF